MGRDACVLFPLRQFWLQVDCVEGVEFPVPSSISSSLTALREQTPLCRVAGPRVDLVMSLNVGTFLPLPTSVPFKRPDSCRLVSGRGHDRDQEVARSLALAQHMNLDHDHESSS